MGEELVDKPADGNSGHRGSGDAELGVAHCGDSSRVTPVEDRVTPVQDVGENLRLRSLEQEVAEQGKALKFIYGLSEATSTALGAHFFPNFARCLAEILEVEFATVTEHLGSPATHARTLGFWGNGKFHDSVTYPLAGTPCGTLVDGTPRNFPDRVQEKFPTDHFLVELGIVGYCGIPVCSSSGAVLGHVCVFGPDPLHQELEKNPVMRLFAARAGAELERLRVESELQKLRDELAFAGRLSTLGQMAATIAHEVNQPLGAISSYAEAALRLMEQEDCDPAEPLQLLKKVGLEAHRAGEIIRRVRGFVRPQSGGRSTVWMNEIVESVMVLASGELRSSGVECDLKLGSDTRSLVANSIQVQQVILNLIRNALESISRAGSRPGRVHITTKASARGVEVVIEDNGEGFAPERFDDLCQPFHSEREGGVGLGLSISRTIVESHGGRIWATNASGGAGVALHLDFPCTDKRREVS